MLETLVYILSVLAVHQHFQIFRLVSLLCLRSTFISYDKCWFVTVTFVSLGSWHSDNRLQRYCAVDLNVAAFSHSTHESDFDSEFC